MSVVEGFGAIGITKPHKFIGFGAIAITKPYKFIGFGTIAITKPYKFIGLGASQNTCRFGGKIPGRSRVPSKGVECRF